MSDSPAPAETFEPTEYNELHTPTSFYMDFEMDTSSLFRPVKRRKFLRRRGDDDATEDAPIDVERNSPPPQTVVQSSGEVPDFTSSTLSVQEIIRLRKLRRTRKGGIEFSNLALSTGPTSTSNALIPQDTDTGQIKDITDRFAPHTGQVVNTNNHMVAYIESELAKRRQAAAAASSSTHTASHNASAFLGSASSNDRAVQKQPASLGKLHEIDLGPDSTISNIARTEAAARRLEGQDTSLEDDSRAQKPRIGRNGKPYRPRKRRNSNDLRRDKLVEEVLRESKLEIYDDPTDLAETGDSEAADDRIAEQFRRDFMEQIQTRRQRQPVAKNAKDAKVEGPKGPKLGGSRSARAAMHKVLEEAAGKK